MDEILKAHAMLGVRPGVSLRQLRRRYRALVMKWHPDRVFMDQVEAATMLRQINEAYRTLLKYLVVDAGKPGIPGNKWPQRAVRERLSPNEAQRVMTAIQTNGPVDDLLSSFDPPIFFDFPRDFGALVLDVVLAEGAVCAVAGVAVWLGVAVGSSTFWIVAFVNVAVFNGILWWRWRARRHREPRLPTPWS